MNPEPTTAPSPISTNKRPSSLASRSNKMENFHQKLLERYIENVTTIQVPFTLEDLKKKEDDESLNHICDHELGPNTVAQCMSARFVDANDEPILFYFGKRISNTPGVSDFFMTIYPSI